MSLTNPLAIYFAGVCRSNLGVPGVLSPVDRRCVALIVGATGLARIAPYLPAPIPFRVGMWTMAAWLLAQMWTLCIILPTAARIRRLSSATAACIVRRLFSRQRKGRQVLLAGGRFLVSAAVIKDKSASALFSILRRLPAPCLHRVCPAMASAALMLAAATPLRSIPLRATPVRSSTMRF